MKRKKLNKYIPASTEGIYFLLEKGKVVYIGATKNFPVRIVRHSDKRFDAMRFIPCDNYKGYEKRLIKRFRPKYNIQALPTEMKNWLHANGHIYFGKFVNY